MTTISTDNKVVTLINVFTVEPENQQTLVDMLLQATEKTMKTLPGFVSANIHKSWMEHVLRTMRSGVVGKISRQC